MSMEKFYQKCMFDICNLVKGKQYKRAISLCQFLVEKGFRTNELVVVLSYAKRQLEGPRIAIDLIKQYQQNNHCPQISDSKQDNTKSPLIQLALTQYSIEIENLKQAIQSLNTFDLQKQKQRYLEHQQNQQKNTLPSNQLVQMLRKIKSSYEKVYQNQKSHKETPQLDVETLSDEEKSITIQKFTRQINRITLDFIKQKQLNSKEKETAQLCPQIILKYGQFYLEYDDIKQQILTILSDQLKFDPKKIFNVSLRKKKAKMSQHNMKSPAQKIKKQNTRELFYKQVKPLTSLQKNGSKHHNRSNMSRRYQVTSNDETQQYLSELKILLRTVNRFILFSKTN